MIFYITTHENNVVYANKIKELFAKTKYEYYFVYGKNQKQKVEPFIEVDCDEKYENLPLKTYYIVEHFLNSSYKKMIKMDDNVFVDFSKFHPETIEEDYVGMFMDYAQDERSSLYHWYKISTQEYKIPKKTFSLKYAQGSCYLLSRKAALICYKHGKKFFENTPSTYLGEDVKVGMCLSSRDIKILDLFKSYNILYETGKDLMVIHPIHFILYDKLFAATTEQEKIKILNDYNFLNDNLKRDIFLNECLKKP